MVLTPGSVARLTVVVRAGRFRLAVPAPSVLEVSRLSDAQAAFRGLPAESLTRLLGDADPGGEERWGIALGWPTPRAFRVGGVEGVVDLRDAVFFNLPAVLATGVPGLFRGAVMIGGSLALEVVPEHLVLLEPAPEGEPTRGSPLRLAASLESALLEPIGRALVFSAGGGLIGLGLTQVLSVIAGLQVTAVPRVAVGHRGLVVYSQSLYPVLDLGQMFFGRPTSSAFGVVAEVDGTSFVAQADAILGVREGLRAADPEQPEWRETAAGERVMFPGLRAPK